MLLHHLTVMNYRNLQMADLQFSPNVNCLVGSNGVGKSNVLDAVYFLSFCRGFSSVQDSLNLRHGAEFFMLDGEYVKDGGSELHVVCSLKKGGRKRLKIDDKDVKRISEHVGHIPLVMIAPADSELVTGGSEARRHFMDTVLMQLDAPYLNALIRYDQALKQRNALLKQEEEPDWRLMDVLEDMMGMCGELIYSCRKMFVDEFTPMFDALYHQISDRDDEHVALVYQSHGERGDLRPQLKSWREKERIVGYSLHGIHKDELSLTLNGFPGKKEASQGQQKTFFIAMKLAQYLYLKSKGASSTPLLLLDDIFDKLDAHRVQRIIEYVSGNDFGQIFITDTRREHLDSILAATQRDYRLFEVDNGEVRCIPTEKG